MQAVWRADPWQGRKTLTCRLTVSSATRPPSPASIDYKWKVLVAVVFGIFMVVLDTTVVNVAFPALRAEFGAPLGEAQAIVSIYVLALGALRTGVRPESARLRSCVPAHIFSRPGRDSDRDAPARVAAKMEGTWRSDAAAGMGSITS